LRRQLRLVQILESQPVTSTAQLSGNAGRQRSTGLVEYPHGIVGQGASNRERTTVEIVAGDVMTGGEGGVRRGAVAVDETETRVRLQHSRRVGRRHHITAGEQLSQSPQC